MNIQYIKDLEDPLVSLYNSRAETRLRHYYEPEPGLFIAETPMVIERALKAGYEPFSVLGEEKILNENLGLFANCADDLPVRVCTDDILKEIAGYKLARGLMCAMRRKVLPSLTDVCSGAFRVVLMEEVQNPTNIGAIFRSAAALGMDAVLLTKGCSDPLYRRASRVSMGNVFQIPWTFFDERLSAGDRVRCLKSLGYRTLAMALTDDSVPLGSFSVREEDRIAVIMGTESTGLSTETLHECDTVIRIPMQNGVDSLNVAAASAVAFWELRKREENADRSGLPL